MRLDLATDLRARLGAPDKDARLTNAFVEVKAGPVAKNSAYPAKKETCVRKRPGCVTTGYDYTTPIQGASGSLPYLIYDDTFSAFDAVPVTSALIGDLVGGYYAMIDNPPTSPGPGDDYWSVTPPGSSRYMIAGTTYDDYSTHYCTMSVNTTSPVKDQVLSQKSASISAACKSMQAVIAAAQGLIVWLLDSQTLLPPTAAYTVFRFYPTSLPYHSSGVIYADDGYLDSQTGIDWSAGYVPAQTTVPTTPYGFAGAYTIGPVKSEHSHSSISITSTGSVARIAAADIGLTAGSYYLSQVRYIEVSGANEAEYNGTFIGWITTDDLQTKADFINDMNDGWMYYQMSGTPSSATATGTIVVKSYY